MKTVRAPRVLFNFSHVRTSSVAETLSPQRTLGGGVGLVVTTPSTGKKVRPLTGRIIFLFFFPNAFIAF